ncbi:hypothetical protein GCM10023083_61480 [Streptomyces phyllanthi]
MDHLEHLDKHLVEELAQVARETVRDELREQTRKQRRTAVLYAASGTVALYAGGALAVTLGLALALGLPGWAAALITAVVLGAVAYALRSAAHSSSGARSRPAHGSAHRGEPAGGRDRFDGGTAPGFSGVTAPGAPTGGPGQAQPPVPPVPPAPPVPPQTPHYRDR